MNKKAYWIFQARRTCYETYDERFCMINIEQLNIVQHYNRFMDKVDKLGANIGVYQIAIGGN